MLRMLVLLLLFSSNSSHGQHKHDSLVYHYLDSIWQNQPIQEGFVLNLDSTKMDHYRLAFPRNTLILRMKYGYVHDRSGIYFFEVISSDLPKFLSDPYKHVALKNYPEHTYFKLNAIFNGSKLRCYKTHDMRSGSGKEHPLFLESIVDYSFKDFNLPFVIRDKIRCVIK